MSNAKYNIVVFSPCSWNNPLKQRIHHMLSVMKDDNCNVLFVDNCSFREKAVGILMNPKRLVACDLKKISRNLTLLKIYNTFPQKICDRLPFLLHINNYLVMIYVKWAIKKLAFDKVIIGTENIYNICRIIDKFGCELIFYDCMDEQCMAPNVNENLARKCENMVLEKADIVFASAKKLMESRKEINRNIYIVSNGVNFEFFAKCANENAFGRFPFAKDSPCVGYVGAIDDWFDFDLIEYLLLQRKDYNIVLVGGAFGKGRRGIKDLLGKYNNFHWIDRVEYEEVPSYINHFDVGIIPFKINEYIKGVNPIKIYEYFAMGKPVVSTSWKELEGYINYPLSLASTKEQFLECIEFELKNDSHEKKNERKRIANANSWQKKVFKIRKLLERQLKSKNEGTSKLENSFFNTISAL